MPYNGSGSYSAPSNSWNPAVGGTTISSADWNSLLTDLETALSTVITKDGQTTITANLPMSGFKHTGVNTNSGSTSRSEYASGATLQDGAPLDAGDTGGTSTAYTATLTPAITAYADKQCFRVKFNATSGATPTINFNSVGAKKMYRLVGTTATQITTDDLKQNFVAILRYDTSLDSSNGAFWVLNLSDSLSGSIAFSGDISPAQITADQNDYNPTGLSSASTLRLTSDASRNITGLQGGADGRIILIHNVGAQNIVLVDESASSSAANRFAMTGDYTLLPDDGVFLQYDSTSSRWRLIGKNILAATQAEMETGTSTTVYVSPGRQQYHESAAKFWVNFNGTGTIAIRADYNVSSLSDYGNGYYGVNFTTAMSSADYEVSVNANRPAVNTLCSFALDDTPNISTTAVRVTTSGATGTQADFSHVLVAGHGDQ